MDLQRASTPVSVDRRSLGTTSLNDKLDINYVDLGKCDDSWSARYTKFVTGFVGDYVTPRQLLVVLRVLKAVTFSFLILTLCADLMYIVFLEVLATKEVKDIVGGRRDMIIRVYGLILTVAAIAIEVDASFIVKAFYGFKGYLARGFLLFFISAITGAHPLQMDQKERNGYPAANNNQASYSDDAAYANADDAVVDDAAANDAADAVYDDLYYKEGSNVPDIPNSVVVFMMVTSFVLGLCAIIYFVFGAFCLDRFTSRAYLSNNDPLVSTAIPQPNSCTNPAAVYYIVHQKREH
ncbi:hypothetical protein IV203_005951 [Nitzschia inconspicua]|uniref:Uncharacterized protein n=1 Tax=Nitzschia inconspicua TaxID=303405 RepID=A0A9K3KNL9_9STRA|nr:hypothetical protein IV203_005951 [Nitzschia inconspicua]